MEFACRVSVTLKVGINFRRVWFLFMLILCVNGYFTFPLLKGGFL